MRLLAAAALVLAFPAAARAELVRLSSGQVVSVSSYAVDGDFAVMTLKSGGTVRAPKAIVVEVGPDEIATPDPVAPPALAAVPVAAAVAPAAMSTDAIHLMIDRLAQQYGVDRNLAHAVVQIESNYDSRAVSRAGAMGLMQLMPETAKDYAIADPFDPEQNVSAGLQHLHDLLKRFDTATALAAYNAGEGTVERYRGIPPFAETRDYVQQVMALAKKPAQSR